ncbi:MAG: trypsin-like peptidase domain-containing protein [Bacilli bacterium]|nr:trypsin-like peptidase domain-containing protein [Bacilli bacterium]
MNNKKMWIIPVTTIIGCCLVVCLLVGLLFPYNGGYVGSDVTNKVTNEITNKVVEYENVSVEDLQTAVNEAYEKVEHAVIGVTCKQVMSTGFVTSDVNHSLGSGVIYKREEIKTNGEISGYKYYVITNRHVILGDDETKEYKIFAYLGEEDLEFPATIVGYDKKVDIAVITFECTKYIQPVKIADSDELDKGDFVIAVGNPDGYYYYGSVTFGVVSGEARYLSSDTDDDGIEDFYSLYIQHDVAINPGNSGGGLFNLYGELVGINTLKLVSDEIEGMGFAIPSNIVSLLVNEYIEPGKEIVRARLGVMGVEVRSLTDYAVATSGGAYKEIPDIYNGETRYGIYVSEISKESTLYNSGIEPHDIILSVGGVKASRTYVINAKLNSLVDFQVGDEVEIVYYSRIKNRVVTTTVTLKP